MTSPSSPSAHDQKLGLLTWFFMLIFIISLLCNGLFVWKQKERDREVVTMVQRYLELRLAISDQHRAYLGLLQRLDLLSEPDHTQASHLLSLDQQETELRLQTLRQRYPRWVKP